MPEIFFTADTHFGHANILKHEPVSRPFNSIEEHDETLIARWNTVVSKRDTVWHLGDAAWHASDLKLFERLNGIKKLVLGNHDYYAMVNYLQVFSKLHGYFEYRENVFLSHCPIHPIELENRYALNIHGHLHSENIVDARYVNVGVDQWDLAPVPWDVIKGRMESR